MFSKILYLQWINYKKPRDTIIMQSHVPILQILRLANLKMKHKQQMMDISQNYYVTPNTLVTPTKKK